MSIQRPTTCRYTHLPGAHLRLSHEDVARVARMTQGMTETASSAVALHQALIAEPEASSLPPACHHRMPLCNAPHIPRRHAQSVILLSQRSLEIFLEIAAERSKARVAPQASYFHRGMPIDGTPVTARPRVARLRFPAWTALLSPPPGTSPHPGTPPHALPLSSAPLTCFL